MNYHHKAVLSGSVENSTLTAHPMTGDGPVFKTGVTKRYLPHSRSNQLVRHFVYILLRIFQCRTKGLYMQHKDKIIQLHKEGKSRVEIRQILGCSKSTISFHLSDGQKQKHNIRQQKRRTNSPLLAKIERFKHTKYTEPKSKHPSIKKAIYMKLYDFSKDRKTQTMINQPTYTYEQVMEKIGPNPTCYLTGQPIDLSKPKTYNLDHITPVSKGGDNSLDNMGLCTRDANMAKNDLTLDEFIQLCKMVVNHQAED